MITSIFGLVAVLLALLAVALQRFYSSVPPKELRRLAARGDHLARVLYRPVAYGASLRLLLWMIATAGLSVGFFLFAQTLPAAVLLPLVFLILTIVLVWLPSVHLSTQSVRLAVWAAPVLDKLLGYAHSLLDPAARLLNRYRVFEPHSGLFEKEDFAALVTQQKEQIDNRLADDELELLQRTLRFGDTQAADIVQPRKTLRLLDAKETIGPVLMDELHKNGQPIFLVYEGDADTIIGTLAMRQAAAAKQGGKVKDLVRAELCFVHEDFTLPQVAEALAQTKQYAAVVVNGFEEVVGLITLEQLLHEAFGVQSLGEQLSFENRIAVAAYKPTADDKSAAPQRAATSRQATEAAETTDASLEAPEVVK